MNYISNHSGKAIFLENIWDVTDDLLCEVNGIFSEKKIFSLGPLCRAVLDGYVSMWRFGTLYFFYETLGFVLLSTVTLFSQYPVNSNIFNIFTYSSYWE